MWVTMTDKELMEEFETFERETWAADILRETVDVPYILDSGIIYYLSYFYIFRFDFFVLWSDIL
jgi:hypothetical protein